jgi:methionyl-tRNA synthetase
MVKVSANRFVSNRVTAIGKDVKTGTQRLRNTVLSMLEETFMVAAKVARGEIRYLRINGKMVPISLNQPQKRTCLAEHIAKTMNSIAHNFDEREINHQLNELERLINEAAADPKDQKPKTTLHAHVRWNTDILK